MRRERDGAKEQIVGIKEGPRIIRTLVALNRTVFTAESGDSWSMAFIVVPSPLHCQKGIHRRSHECLRIFSAMSVHHVIRTCVYHSCASDTFNTVDVV